MSKKMVRNTTKPVDHSAEVEEEFQFNAAKARLHILPRNVRKVRVNIWLDDDIVAEYKARAEQPNAAPYQTQINQTLRESLGKVSPRKTQPLPTVASLESPQFIKGLAEKIGEYLIAHSSVAKRKRKAA